MGILNSYHNIILLQYSLFLKLYYKIGKYKIYLKLNIFNLLAQ